MNRKRLLVLVALVSFPGLTPEKLPLEHFVYDRNVPLGLEQEEVEESQGVIIRKISYSSPGSGRVTAWLLQQNSRTDVPGILFFHYPGRDHRTSFMAEALALAEAGAVCLLIEASFEHAQSDNTLLDPAMSLEEGPDLIADTVVDARRGIDLIQSLPQVNRGRLGFAGHGLGATLGGILAGVDRRFRAVALAGGASHLSRWLAESAAASDLRRQLNEKRLKTYLKLLRPFDAGPFMAASTETYFLYQFGQNDELVGKSQAEGWQAATPFAETRWYETDHTGLLKLDEPAEERMNWLAEHLQLFP